MFSSKLTALNTRNPLLQSNQHRKLNPSKKKSLFQDGFNKIWNNNNFSTYQVVGSVVAHAALIGVAVAFFSCPPAAAVGLAVISFGLGGDAVLGMPVGIAMKFAHATFSGFISSFKG